MPGYRIFEERYLTIYKEDGITPNETKLGFLDFLRELKGGVIGIPNLSSFMIVGLEEVFYQVPQKDRGKYSLTIHKVLQSAATILEKRKVEVQICCKGTLYKANSFWLEYRSEKIILDAIFGTPTKIDIRGCPVYSVSFNLSS